MFKHWVLILVNPTLRKRQIITLVTLALVIIITGLLYPTAPASSQGSSLTGEGVFYATDGRGAIARWSPMHQWRDSWSLIIPGNFDDNEGTDLLFYDRAAGHGEFYTVDSNGAISQLGTTHTGWRNTWDIIVPDEEWDLQTEDGTGYSHTALLFYDRAAGHGEFYVTDHDANIFQVGATHTGWRRSWDIIIPGRFDFLFANIQQTQFIYLHGLFFYDRAAGESVFYSVDWHGSVYQIGSVHTNWSRSLWRMIIPGNFDPFSNFDSFSNSPDELLFYGDVIPRESNLCPPGQVCCEREGSVCLRCRPREADCE